MTQPSDSQPQFNNTVPNQGSSMYMQNSPEQMRGAQLAQTSMILGILSLFVPLVGIVLGIIAINKAKEAEQLHTAATVGKVTGWVGTILWILSVIPILLLIPLVFFAGA